MLMILFSIVMSGCIGMKQASLPPYYYYEGSYIDIHSPNSNSWNVVKKSQSQISFAKKGFDEESYVAQVVFFPLEKTNSDKEFLEQIRSQTSINSNNQRYKLIKSSAELYKKRSYPCVITKQLVEDTQAKTGFFSKDTLLMETKSLYCKDPKREKAGFLIGYSFRGKVLNPHLNDEADSFIKGVYFRDLKN